MSVSMNAICRDRKPRWILLACCQSLPAWRHKLSANQLHSCVHAGQVNPPRRACFRSLHCGLMPSSWHVHVRRPQTTSLHADRQLVRPHSLHLAWPAPVHTWRPSPPAPLPLLTTGTYNTLGLCFTCVAKQRLAVTLHRVYS